MLSTPKPTKSLKVGIKANAKVGITINKIESMNMFLRPNLSPKWAITMPPSGRAK
ncbi:hypothetical protein BTM356_04630 [Helicobacter pylori]